MSNFSQNRLEYISTTLIIFLYYTKRIYLILTNTFRNVSRPPKTSNMGKTIHIRRPNSSSIRIRSLVRGHFLTSWNPFKVASKWVQTSPDDEGDCLALPEAIDCLPFIVWLFARLFKLELQSSDTLIRVPLLFSNVSNFNLCLVLKLPKLVLRKHHAFTSV